MQIPPLRTLQDVVNAGKEVRDRGYTALKTNVFVLGPPGAPYLHSPGFARAATGFPELNADRHVLDALRDELAAFREGAGPDMDILVDLNFNFKTEGFLKVARAIEPFDIFWVEIDTRDPRALHYIRRARPFPWPPASASSGAATTARTSSSRRSTSRSSTRRGTAWRSR